MWTAADVQKAESELSNKNLALIQEETAYVWGARALAAFNLYQQTQNGKYLGDSLEYRHESIEHAALAGPAVYALVRSGLAALDRYL
jgi:hypothetical protein